MQATASAIDDRRRVTAATSALRSSKNVLRGGGAAESSSRHSRALIPAPSGRRPVYPLPPTAPRRRGRPPRGGPNPSWRSAPAAASDPASAGPRPRPARPRPRPRRRQRRPRPDRPDRGGAGPRGRARGGSCSPRSRRPSSARTRTSRARGDPRGRGAAPSRSFAAQEAKEYAYVARDVKDIVRIAALLFARPVRPLYLIIDVVRRGHDRLTRTLRGPTIAAMPDPARRLRRPPRTPVPAAARAAAARRADAPADARRVRGPGAPRRRARAAPPVASPAATSRRCCCGDRPAPARRRSPGCSRRPSAPSSGPCRRSCRAWRRSAPTIAEAQDRLALNGTPVGPVHRRDPPLQQGPAGRAAAARRGRHGHAHRRDDREPVLRGQLRAPVADAGVAPRAADRRGRRARSSGARSRTRSAGSPGSFGPSGGVALADEAFDHLVDLAGGDARQALNVLEGAVALAEDEDAATPTAASPPPSPTSRRPPSSGSSPTTAPATATTTRCRRSSRASAATTPTARCTGWRRWSRPARTRGSSPGG